MVSVVLVVIFCCKVCIFCVGFLLVSVCFKCGISVYWCSVFKFSILVNRVSLNSSNFLQVFWNRVENDYVVRFLQCVMLDMMSVIMKIVFSVEKLCRKLCVDCRCLLLFVFLLCSSMVRNIRIVVIQLFVVRRWMMFVVSWIVFVKFLLVVVWLFYVSEVSVLFVSIVFSGKVVFIFLW